MTEYEKIVQDAPWGLKRASGQAQADEWNPMVLKAKIKFLELWQQKAIRRYPDLGEEGE